MKFYKRHGLGNDFAILQDSPLFDETLIPHIAHRRLGIGCDQVILYKDLEVPEVRFFNKDGSSAEQCGNGLRCVAGLLMKQRNVNSIRLKTPTGFHHAHMLENNIVKIEMGIPTFHWDDLPLSHQLDLLDLFVDFPAKPILSSVSIGNPHAVIFMKNPTRDIAKKLGSPIEKHPLFPHKANVHFAEILHDDYIKMIPWERGTGITDACGSGACAVHAAAYQNKLIQKNCTVEMPGGCVSLETRTQDGMVLLTGAIAFVFKGQLIN